MRDGNLRTLLVTTPLPDDLEARRRSWAVVRRAFDEREAVRRRPSLRPALALAVLAAGVAAALSPAGEAVVERFREAVGVERAAPALFSLPTGGRLLVQSDAGPWIVNRDGSKRLLGHFSQASWSPRGLFVVATEAGEGTRHLHALDPKGETRWSLARPAHLRFPRWAGLRGDTRIAYVTGSSLRVVAGDGTGDRVLARRVAPVAPAWWQAARHVLAYAEPSGRVAVRDADTGAVLFRTGRLPGVRALEWSKRGRLLVVTRAGLVLFGAEGRRIWRRPIVGVRAVSFAPDGRRLAVLRPTEVLVLDAGRPTKARRVFGGAGPFAGVAWSPNARWLLVGWPSADQWVFVRVGDGRLRPVANVSAQFRSGRFPMVAGWCCSP